MIATHEIGVVYLLADRLLVMKGVRVVDANLADRVGEIHS